MIIQSVKGLQLASMPIPPAVIDFLDLNFHYKSVATQIPHAGLTLINTLAENSSHTGDQTSAVSCSTSSEQYALNCMDTEPGSVLLYILTITVSNPSAF